MSYAIISLGGKQYRVQEGERLLVDRLPTEEGKTFHPDVMLIGGNGKTELSPKGVQVTARVVGRPLGKKIRIGKVKRRTGYRRHTGFRAKLSQIEIESIGASRARASSTASRTETAAPVAKPDDAPKGLPKGYAELTVAAISEAAPGWNRPMLEAALAYEQEHAKRKGALAAIESALEDKEG